MSFYDDLEKYGSNIALVDENEEMDYVYLATIADQIMEQVPSRSLAFILCKNRMETVVGYVGMMRKRIVPIMINSSLNKELYEVLQRTYRPEYIWCPKKFMEGKEIAAFEGYVLIETGESTPEMDADLALLLTTSGSTGSPKLVRQTYRNIDSNTDSIVEYLKISSEDRGITTLPMNYTYGLSILQSHLSAGARLILTEKTFLEKEFWMLFREKEATTFGGVPYTYEMLDRLRFLQMELPSLRYVTQAGGKLSKELHFKFASGLRDQGKAFIVMYGATEATARMSYVPAENAVEKAGSIGIAIPGGRFELLDAEGNLIEESDKVGELIYYGKNVTLGYAESRIDLVKGDERQGRLETGDMAQRDKDGYYYVVGRKKRFLKLYGNRVNLMEMETILGKKGYESACVGEDDHMRIYTTSRDTEHVIEILSEITHINRAAFTAIFIESIPRNDSGKVLYSELK